MRSSLPRRPDARTSSRGSRADYILGTSLPRYLFRMSNTEDRGLPVLREMRMHPSPLLYCSMTSISPGPNPRLGPLTFLSPVDHERVLHLGHLRGMLSVRGYHLWPHMRQTLRGLSSDQRYEPHLGQRAGRSSADCHVCAHLLQSCLLIGPSPILDV